GPLHHGRLFPSWPGVSRPPAHWQLYSLRSGPTGWGWVAGTRPAMTILGGIDRPRLLTLMPRPRLAIAIWRRRYVNGCGVWYNPPQTIIREISPCNNCMGVGGHPRITRSTGITAETPPTTAGLFANTPASAPQSPTA